MYGTVARMQVKAGMEQQFLQVVEKVESAYVPGAVAVYVYQMDANSGEFYMTVVFESKEAYVANANSPEQHQRFLQIMSVLETEPEWHDGAVVFSHT